MSNKPAEPGQRGSGRIETTGRFSAGNSIGRQGRPRDSITNALRRQVDPEQIAAFLLGVIADPGSSTKDRLRACELVQDRLEGRAVARSLKITHSATAILPVGFHELPHPQRLRVLDEIRARALDAGDDTEGDDSEET